MSLIIVLLLITIPPFLVRVVYLVLLLLKVHSSILGLELVSVDTNQDDIRSQMTDPIPRNLPAIHTVLLSMFSTITSLSE